MAAPASPGNRGARSSGPPPQVSAPAKAGSLLPLAILAGCGYSIRDSDLERLERGELAPGEAVFTCHGIFRDLGFPWDYKLRDEVIAGPGGRLTVVVTYWSDFLGLWFGFGKKAPGKVMADLADEMETLHRSTGCPAPLSIRAIGYSAGCNAILEAARLARAARFDRVLFLNSASFAFSREPHRLIEAGKIGRLASFWSPFDLVTLLAPLGAGQLGNHPEGGGIENRCIYNLHLPPLTGFGRRRVKEYLLEEETLPPLHNCQAQPEYLRKLSDVLRRGRARAR